MKKNRWQDYEMQYLLENYENKSNDEIMKGLYLLNLNKKNNFDRSILDIKTKANRMGLKKNINIRVKNINKFRQGFNYIEKKYKTKKIYSDLNSATLPQYILKQQNKRSI